tara:strand:- start:1760 stop:2695 length:936 start_codon:yes stop_codon:yes gene_type:complete
MNYHNLITKPFINKITRQKVTTELITEALQYCFDNCAFSTFPYIMYNMNSKQAIDTFKSGNCVALSMFLQKHLLEKYKIKSYLIPATIPNKYKIQGLLDISHVALAIPKTKNNIFIADVAFYFLTPIEIKINKQLNKSKCSTILSKEIYSGENATNIQDYSTLTEVKSDLIKNSKRIQFNRYQSIPANTYACKCYYTLDKDDTWCYYLRQVKNPDRAISTFFLNCKKYPFICSTKKDNNNICMQDIYLKFLENNKIKLSFDAKQDMILDKNNITQDIINKINTSMQPFFIYDILDYLLDIPYQNNVYTVND